MAAAPAVPAAEIAALAFLAEHPEMDVVLTLCGFEEPIARQRLIQREGFDNLESFGDFSSESIDSMARRHESYTPVAQRVNFGMRRIAKFKAIAYWVRKCRHEGTTVDVANLSQDVITQMGRELTLVPLEPKRDDKLFYPPKFDPNNYVTWERTFENYLDSLKGKSKIPLSYIIRPVDADPATATSDYQRTIWQAPHVGYAFEEDNREVYRIYKDLMIGTDGWTWFHRAPEGNGRSAHILISEHYRGTAETARRAAEAEAQLAKLFYKGETPLFKFETYITRLRECFELLEDNDQGYSGAQKVNAMLKGITSTHPRITSLSTTILTTHPTDFEGASSVMANVISRIFPAVNNPHDGRAKRQISAFEQNEERNRNHQHDALTRVMYKKVRQYRDRQAEFRNRGRGHRGGRWANGVDISDPTRYFSADEWNRLRDSPDYQWVIDRRAGNGRGGRGRSDGHGGRGQRGRQSNRGGRGAGAGGNAGRRVAFVEQQQMHEDQPSNHDVSQDNGDRGGHAGIQFGGRRYQQPRGPGRT
jgi:hypothetical protein